MGLLPYRLTRIQLVMMKPLFSVKYSTKHACTLRTFIDTVETVITYYRKIPYMEQNQCSNQNLIYNLKNFNITIS